MVTCTISKIRGVQVIALLITLASSTLCEHLRLRYSNEWVIRIQGGVSAAQTLANSMGYSYAGQVPGFPDTYLLLKPDQPRHHKRAFPMLTKRLANDRRVEWAEQQFYKLRQKRDFAEGLPNVAHHNASTADGLAPWWQEGVPRRRRRGDVELPSSSLFNDELWEKQWYLQDTRTRLDLPPLDLQVLPVYARGYTGKGVRVTVLDDGVEHTHEDLRDNYDPAISYDVDDNDPDPSPRYEPLRRNAHGTRCAGEIAMKANNIKCGVGVAFNARIGGVRLLDGDVNDRMEGTALGWARGLVDIYSASWGPNDDGATVEGPGRLAQEALRKGVTEGRGGRGSIYIWASGNGGTLGDNCNCDGYVNSIYTLAVGSASERGHFPWYGERCASTMAAAYSSGAYRDQMIATTDLRNSCTVRHTGTSAAAPLAAGIIALALEANPELTWRDMQHLVAVSAEATPLADNPGWRKNAAGFWANTRFGFGLLNADRLVRAAEKWLPIPPKAQCDCKATPRTNSTFFRGDRITIEFECDACSDTPQQVNYLEHVQVLSNVQYPERGALEIYLTSPGGTKVQLLSPRKNDKSDRGFVDWTFMSVLTWGEVPKGKWLIEIIDKSIGPTRLGAVGYFRLTFHGTAELPAYRLELNTTDLPSRPVYGNNPVLIHDLDNHIDIPNDQNLALDKVPDPDVDIPEPMTAIKGSPLVKLLNKLNNGGV